MSETRIADHPQLIAEFVTWWHEHRDGSPNAAYARVDRFVKDSMLAPAAHQETPEPELYVALRDLLDVIATDDLIPESVSYMKAARAAIARFDRGAPARAAEWQPIETAPKDTQVWAWDDRRGGNPAMFVSDVDEWFITYDDAVIQPTHWMPLPLPPCALTGTSNSKT